MSRPYRAPIPGPEDHLGFDWEMNGGDETWNAQIDVAGVTVSVDAPRNYAGLIRGRLGAVAGRRVPEIDLTASAASPMPPDRPADQSMEGFSAWEESGSLWIGRHRACVRIADRNIHLGGALDEESDEDTLDDLLQFAIAHALASPERLMIHGAVIASGQDALVVVGRSGQGKSTLAAAALVGGWQLLGDDLALVHPHDSRVRAVQRPPMVPSDIAELHDLHGEKERSPRGRIRLPVDVLQPASRHLIGVVSVAHGIAGGVETRSGADVHTLDNALAVPPFRAVIRRHLAAGAALVAKPTVVLEHAEDPTRRVERAITSLEEAMALCRSLDGQ